ncbi:hypothetical protein D3C73_950700 [compost metagenome]
MIRGSTFPELFLAINTANSSDELVKNRSGDKRLVAEMVIPLANNIPRMIPAGIPIPQSRASCSDTNIYSLLRSAPRARNVPYSRMRFVTEIFKML